VTFLGTLVANNAKIVHFTFYVYFPEALHGATMFFEGHDGPPYRQAPVRSGSENWMSGSGAWKKCGRAGAGRSRSRSGAVNGGYRKRHERWAEISTAPAPRSYALSLKQSGSESPSVVWRSSHHHNNLRLIKWRKHLHTIVYRITSKGRFSGCNGFLDIILFV